MTALDVDATVIDTLDQDHALLIDAITVITTWQGYPPTLRQLAGFLNRPLSRIATQVNRLTTTGYLEQEPGQPRTLRPTPAGRLLLGEVTWLS